MPLKNSTNCLKIQETLCGILQGSSKCNIMQYYLQPGSAEIRSITPDGYTSHAQ